jgi:hypothetical protein
MDVFHLPLLSAMQALRGRPALGFDHGQGLISMDTTRNTMATDTPFAGVFDTVYQYHRRRAIYYWEIVQGNK